MANTLTERARRLKPIADRVADDLYHRADIEEIDQSVIRDACDLASGGELETFALDMLCRMVESRLENPKHYGIE